LRAEGCPNNNAPSPQYFYQTSSFYDLYQTSSFYDLYQTSSFYALPSQ